MAHIYLFHEQMGILCSSGCMHGLDRHLSCVRNFGPSQHKHATIGDCSPILWNPQPTLLCSNLSLDFIRPIETMTYALRGFFEQAILYLSLIGLISMDRTLQIGFHPSAATTPNPGEGLVLSAGVHNIYLIFAYGITSCCIALKTYVRNASGTNLVPGIATAFFPFISTLAYAITIAFMRT